MADVAPCALNRSVFGVSGRGRVRLLMRRVERGD